MVSERLPFIGSYSVVHKDVERSSVPDKICDYVRDQEHSELSFCRNSESSFFLFQQYQRSSKVLLTVKQQRTGNIE